jgi:hypothetical protein
MGWFLALQGPTQASQQSSVYELQDATDVNQLAQDLVNAVSLDRVVPVPAMLPQSTQKRQKVTLYVRPAAWGMWTFYELSEEDRRQLMKNNPLLNAIQQAQRGQAAQAGGVGTNPLMGQPGSGLR